MTALAWIVLTGFAMSAIALVGSATLLMKKATLDRIVMPLVAFAAGSLLGGAFLHMLPAASHTITDPIRLYLWTLTGFTVFFALEQFLHWHHCQRAQSDCKEPLTYLVLVEDGLHNFLGGLGVGPCSSRIFDSGSQPGLPRLRTRFPKNWATSLC